MEGDKAVTVDREEHHPYAVQPWASTATALSAVRCLSLERRTTLPDIDRAALIAAARQLRLRS